MKAFEWASGESPYDNGSLVPEKLRDEIKAQQKAVTSGWTTAAFAVPWTFAWDVVRLVETLARYAVVRCRECGESYDTSSTSDGVRLAKEQLCFTCAFWAQKVQWREAGDTHEGRPVVRVEGRHYVAGNQTGGDPSHRGMSGRHFAFRFVAGPRAGQDVETVDLWFQGDIPEHFRERLPDNAVSRD